MSLPANLVAPHTQAQRRKTVAILTPPTSSISGNGYTIADQINEQLNARQLQLARWHGIAGEHWETPTCLLKGNISPALPRQS